VTSFQAEFKKFTLKFIKPMGTSRGVLHERDTFILGLKRPENSLLGLGECAPLTGLSVDDRPDFADKLQQVCHLLNRGLHPFDLDLADWPSIKFGLEAAFMDLENGGTRRLFKTGFTYGKQNIPINGLIVISDIENMLEQAFHKIQMGFDCIKIKIGAHDFEAECKLLSEIRKKVPHSQVEIRLDVNGAFKVDAALDKIGRLAEYGIHSLEQPIKPGQWQAMADICAKSPVPIALDEELIGIKILAEKEQLLKTINPQFIVLKPTLVGGLKASTEWISLANRLNIAYWVTSALESNIGLNIISQWASTLPLEMHQGLGTGQLFAANFPTPLAVSKGRLTYSPDHRCETLEDLSDLKLRPIS
jgi:o-succinylbenzoate synthase